MTTDGPARQRRTNRGGRRPGAGRKPKRPAMQPDDAESLFVGEEPGDAELDGDGELFGGEGEQPEEDDEELQQAIPMSLQQDVEADQSGRHAPSPSDLEDDWHVVFQQRAVVEAKPVPKGSANAIANILNERAHGIAPESRETTSFGVSVPKSDDTPDDDDDDMHLHAALAESRRTKREVNPPPRRQLGKPTGTPQRQNVMTSPAKPGGFSGPLPFEKLDLGTSLLGKKKMQQRTEEAEGGFEKTDLAARQAKSADPIPPWFNGDIEKDIRKQERLEKADREKARAFGKQFQFQGRDEPLLRRQETEEVIDLDDGEGKAPVCEKKVVGQSEVIKLDDEEGKDGRVPVAPELTGVPVDDEIRMDDMADVVRAEPPVSDKMDYRDGGSRGPPTPSKRPAPFELVGNAECTAGRGKAGKSQDGVHTAGTL
ncbi:DNA repair protein rad2 [Friedmanniomyces endolithicus]|nr:DNA repair protein rad2 [Friedmanniomyces endolithicus]KAK0776504.1 DNA repair protein rad2 [Friedmanniomyces endolithicus]